MDINLLYAVPVFHWVIEEYIKRYHHDDEDDNPLKDLVELCKANGPQFADKLLDYQNVDEKTLMCFYDISTFNKFLHVNYELTNSLWC